MAHNAQWSCDGFDHAPITFPDAASFKEHMRTAHTETANQVSLDRLAEMGVRPPETIFRSSPFCSHTARPQTDAGHQAGNACPLDPSGAEAMEKHILRHLTELFLMALPYHDNIRDNDSARSKSQTVQRSRQDLSELDDGAPLQDSGTSSNQVFYDGDVPKTDDVSWDFVPLPPYDGAESDPQLAAFIKRLVPSQITSGKCE